MFRVVLYISNFPFVHLSEDPSVLWQLKDSHHQRRLVNLSNTNCCYLRSFFPVTLWWVWVVKTFMLHMHLYVWGFLLGPPGRQQTLQRILLWSTEPDICLKTWGTDPPLFLSWLSRQRSKMSSSLTLFCWICSTQSLWIKQGRRWEKSLGEVKRYRNSMLQRPVWLEVTAAAGSLLTGGGISGCPQKALSASKQPSF